MTTVLRTIPEAAVRLCVSRATLYRLVGDGKIRITKVRGRSFVTEAELERYLRNAERRPASGERRSRDGGRFCTLFDGPPLRGSTSIPRPPRAAR